MTSAVRVAGPTDVAAGGIEAATSHEPVRRLDVDVAFMLVDLANAHALTESQARRLYADWLVLDEDAWSQPWLRDVREHTRQYIRSFG